MSFLKKHWGNIISIAGGALAYVDWTKVAGYSASHKATALGVITSAFVILYNARAPKDKNAS